MIFLFATPIFRFFHFFTKVRLFLLTKQRRHGKMLPASGVLPRVFAYGEMAEWSKAPVLKTGDVKASVGSNPTLSAKALYMVLQKYPSGRRGSPAKGVGGLETRARVRLPPSAPNPENPCKSRVSGVFSCLNTLWRRIKLWRKIAVSFDKLRCVCYIVAYKFGQKITRCDTYFGTLSRPWLRQSAFRADSHI